MSETLPTKNLSNNFQNNQKFEFNETQMKNFMMREQICIWVVSVKTILNETLQNAIHFLIQIWNQYFFQKKDGLLFGWKKIMKLILNLNYLWIVQKMKSV